VVVVCGVVVAIVGVSPASADGGISGSNDIDPTSGHKSISVTIQASGTTSGGHTFSTSIPGGSSGGVSVEPSCWLVPFENGAEYYKLWGPNGTNYESGTLDAYAAQGTLPDGIEDHKDDTDGHWYGPWCDIDVPGDEKSKFDLANMPLVWVDGGDEPPAAAVRVDPVDLANAAYDSMQKLLPEGRLDWNPKLKGTGGTIVGKETGVWLDDAARTISVTASVPGGIWARVDANRTDVAVSATGATSGKCASGVTYPAPAADTACLTFDRSTAYLAASTGSSLPTTTMRAASTWTAGWVSSQNAARTELPAQTVTADAQIAVAEIQSIVNP